MLFCIIHTESALFIENLSYLFFLYFSIVHIALDKTFLIENGPAHDKTNALTLHPMKTQIRLGIQPIDQSMLCTKWVDRIQASFFLCPVKTNQ